MKISKISIPRQDLPVLNLVGFDLEDGPWIAGGAPRRWIQKQSVGRADVDIFCKNSVQYNNIVAELDRRNIDRFYNSDNAVSYKSDTHRIQVVKKYFATGEDVLNSFDIRLCQFITDGKNIMFPSEAYSDLKAKKIHFNKFNEVNAVKRTIKYMCYGFTLDEESINQMKSGDITYQYIKNSGDLDYENAF